MLQIRCIVLGLFVTIAANGAPIGFQSSERQVALLELYTSEGCSSCPPAESWLSGLEKKSGLWSEFVPVAFHADYWDYLGWHDKWGKKQFSDRQRDYAGAWGSDNIYTPEFVLNGREWHNGYGLRGAPGLSETKAGILKVTSEDTNHWQVIFIPTEGGTPDYDVHAALLVTGLGSDVKAGENAGRHLKHAFVALTLIHQALVQTNGVFQGMFTMAGGQKTPQGRLALAIWSTHTGHLEPVQAVGGWLGPSEKAE